MIDHDSRVRELVSHAYQHAPAVRRMMDDAGVKPEDIQGTADLGKIPVTSKDRLVELHHAEPPFGGFLAVDPADLPRIYISPGPIFDPQPINPDGAEAALEAAGLKPMIVDVESYASRLAAGRLIQALPNGGVDTMVALFEVGAFTTSMQVIRNDEVLYDRDQAFGGAQLTQLIVRQYGFSPEEAEAKKRSGELPEDYEAGVLKPFVDSMAQEVARALQFFFTSTPHNRVDYVMLAGGSAALPGLTDAVTMQTSFPCNLANPFEGMHVGDGVREKKMRREAPSYLTSCGLAMRRFMQ